MKGISNKDLSIHIDCIEEIKNQGRCIYIDSSVSPTKKHEHNDPKY